MVNENQTNNNSTPFKLPPYPDLSQSWGLFGLFLLFSLALGLLVYPISKLEQLKNWVTMFAYIGSFVLLFLYVWITLKGRQQLFKLKWAKQSIVSYVLLFFIIILLGTVIEPLTAWLTMPDFLKNILKDMVQPDLASFLTVVIAAPICEEILCRGIILEGLLQNKMKPHVAIMWSAFIFAALHLNPWQGIPAFIIGCIMGWVYYKTRSLWLPIFMHFVNNGFSFLILTTTKNPDITTSEFVGHNNYLLVYIAALVLLMLLLYILYRYFKWKSLTQLNADNQLVS